MLRREDYKTDWTKWFNGSHREELGPVQDCYDYEPKKSEYNGVGPGLVVNGDILRFCRNMATHLHQHIPKVCIYIDFEFDPLIIYVIFVCV